MPSFPHSLQFAPPSGACQELHCNETSFVLVFANNWSTNNVTLITIAAVFSTPQIDPEAVGPDKLVTLFAASVAAASANPFLTNKSADGKIVLEGAPATNDFVANASFANAALYAAPAAPAFVAAPAATVFAADI